MFWPRKTSSFNIFTFQTTKYRFQIKIFKEIQQIRIQFSTLYRLSKLQVDWEFTNFFPRNFMVDKINGKSERKKKTKLTLLRSLLTICWSCWGPAFWGRYMGAPKGVPSGSAKRIITLLTVSLSSTSISVAMGD